jgi:hypothetical protein
MKIFFWLEIRGFAGFSELWWQGNAISHEQVLQQKEEMLSVVVSYPRHWSEMFVVPAICEQKFTYISTIETPLRAIVMKF